MLWFGRPNSCVSSDKTIRVFFLSESPAPATSLSVVWGGVGKEAGMRRRRLVLLPS